MKNGAPGAIRGAEIVARGGKPPAWLRLLQAFGCGPGFFFRVLATQEV